MKLSLKNLRILFSFSFFWGLVACSGQNSSDPMVLGSFVARYDATSKTVVHRMATDQRKGTATSQVGVRRILGWDESVLINQGYVSVQNCSAANWNSATQVLSVNYNVTNTSTETIVAPLEYRMTGIETSISNPSTITEVNTDLPRSGCSNPITLTNCDQNGDGYFDIVWPFEAVLDYTDDPGHDLALLMGGDQALDPSESTSCKFLQLRLSVEENVSWYYDILGKIQGVGLPSPYVMPITSPTKTQNVTLRVTIDTGLGADEIRVIGGVSEVSCGNDDGCDLELVTADTVEIVYSLNANQSNTISVFQRNSGTGDESAATVLSIVHDSVDPVLVSMSPSNGSINVSPSGNILATFDGALDPASVTTATVLLNRDAGSGDCASFLNAVNVSLSMPSGNQILIDPTTTLSTNTYYCLRLVGETGACDGSGEIRDEAGNCFRSSLTPKTYASGFRTASSDSTPPIILGTIPTDGSSNISLNSPVQILVNEAVDPATVTTTSVSLTAGSTISATRSVSPDGTTIFLYPDANLAANTLHTITITTALQDLAGNAIATTFTSSFTTSNTVDLDDPEIVAFYPADQAENVNENIRPQIVFNEPMDPSTINSSTIHLDRKSDSLPIPISVSLSADGLTATIIPNSSLDLSTKYLISAEYGCKDLSGRNLASPQTADFTTQGVDDTISPSIVQVTPSDNSNDVNTSTAIVIVFDESIDANTVHTGTFFLQDPSSTPATNIAGSVSVAVDGLSATFVQSNGSLSKNTNYQVLVKGGSSGCTTCVKDLAGNPLQSDFISTFTTAFRDNYDPEVVHVAPGNTATDITVNSSVVVTFSEPILDTSVSSTSVYLRNQSSGVNVSANLTLLPNLIDVRINPSSDLDSNTTYEVYVTSSVKDLSGRSALAFSSSFQTGSLVDSTGPTYVTSTPVDGGIDFPRWQSIEVDFDEPIDPNTVSQNNIELIRDSDSAKMPIRLSQINSASTILVNPVDLLDSSATYTLRLKTGLRNLSGFPLEEFTTVNFTTVNNPSTGSGPTITTVVPATGARGVGTSVVVTITLSSPVDPDKVVNGNVRVVPASGGNPPPKGDLIITLDATRTVITITPITAYQNNTTYNVYLKNSIVDDKNDGINCQSQCGTGSDALSWVSDFRT